MQQNDKNDAQKSASQPVRPRHTYEDKPRQSLPTPDTGNRPAASPSKTPHTKPDPRTTEDPIKPSPDYGDDEPGDPRHIETTGGDSGAQSGSGQDLGGAPSSTLQD